MANANFTCVLEAWRSGKTLYGRMHYYRSDGQTFTYQDSSFPNPTMNLGGTVYTDTDFGNRVRAGIQVGNVYSTTFSRTVAGTGDRTVTWTAGSGSRSDFAGSWSQTVNFPVEVTPPTGLGANNIVRDIESFTANVYISGWGQGSGTRYRELQCWKLGMTEPRRYQPSYGDSLSGNITVSNSSNGSLTIRGNTMYTLGVYASNGQANTGSISLGDYATRAYAPTVSVGQLTDTTAVVSYTLQSDGGQYAKHVQYSLDGGATWTTGATINTGAAYTNTFTITGLSENTTYTLQSRVNTHVGTTPGNSVTFTTEIFGKIYGSVSSKTKRIKKMYGSVNGKTKKILKMYGSVNGKTKRIF